MTEPRTAHALVALAVLILPLTVTWSLRRNGAGDALQSFVANAGRNGLRATVFGAYAGNIGAGSFVAILLFAGESTIIAASLAGVYTVGLVLCAALAPMIRRRARDVNAIGMIDLIARTHAETRGAMAMIWTPVAMVFVLRSSVQLGALGLLISGFIGWDMALTTVISAIVIGGYLVAGGYRAAVETDIVQSVVIITAIVFAATGLNGLTFPDRPVLDLGRHDISIVVGIWLFLPWSPLLAPDNWQRITLAQSDEIARKGYLIAALLCGFSFAVMVLAGLGGQGTVHDTYRALMPPGLGWVSTAMFVACIMSSIDTFIMALTSGLSHRLHLTWLRGIIMALMAVTAIVAIAFGDVLQTIIAAFSALTVFLPAAFGALMLKRPTRGAAGLSMCSGLVAAIAATWWNENIGSLIGFAVAASVYTAVTLLSEPRARCPS